MGKITLIIGGARSGKSAYAENLAGVRDQVIYFATAENCDLEMDERIRRHRAERPPSWITVESPTGLPEAFTLHAMECTVAIIDCLTLYISNLLGAGRSEAEILSEAGSLMSACRKFSGESIIVSNEVGLGIVPPNDLARAYRDILGKFNQIVAAEADAVYLMTAGIPLKIKEENQAPGDSQLSFRAREGDAAIS